MAPSKKERTASIQKSLETRERFPISHFDSRKYIQHNLNIADGLGPILTFMDSLPADRTRVDVRRCFEDGDYSFAHADYLLGDWGQMVGFEVHRWENDRIVEHWDNLQPTPAAPNPSGRSMTDGASEVEDATLSEANKALVGEFADEVLIRRKLGAIGRHFDGDRLVQHSPASVDGVAALTEHLGDAGQPRHERIHKVLGEGNFVLLIGEGRRGEVSTALYDLYRVAGGKLVEHWDVVEDIPPRETWQNQNGKF